MMQEERYFVELHETWELDNQLLRIHAEALRSPAFTRRAARYLIISFKRFTSHSNVFIVVVHEVNDWVALVLARRREYPIRQLPALLCNG